MYQCSMHASTVEKLSGVHKEMMGGWMGVKGGTANETKYTNRTTGRQIVKKASVVS
jgi:hypothetical protein